MTGAGAKVVNASISEASASRRVHRMATLSHPDLQPQKASERDLQGAGDNNLFHCREAGIWHTAGTRQHQSMAGQNPRREGSHEQRKHHAIHTEQAQDIVYMVSDDDDDMLADVLDAVPASEQINLTLDDLEPVTTPDKVWISVGIRERTDLTTEDEKILKSETEWLNDRIINGFIAICNDINTGLQVNRSNFVLNQKIAAVSSFMYTGMNELNDTALNILDKYLNPKTRNADEYRKKKKLYDCATFDKYIIPVNIMKGGWEHWSTAVVDFTKGEIRLYDSAGNITYDETIKAKIIGFLNKAKDKYKHYKSTSFDNSDFTEYRLVRDKRFVRQTDGCSCGVFTCIAIERLFFGGSLQSSEKDSEKGIDAEKAREYRDHIIEMFQTYKNETGSLLFRTGRMLSMLLLQ